MANLNRQTGCHESAMNEERSMRILLYPWSRCYGCGKLQQKGGANVTVSRTHEGFSLYFQIVSTFNRLVAAQGRSLFTDTCGAEKLWCATEFKIAGGVICTSLGPRRGSCEHDQPTLWRLTHSFQGTSYDRVGLAHQAQQDPAPILDVALIRIACEANTA
jgi:hypothetical protein